MDTQTEVVTPEVEVPQLPAPVVEELHEDWTVATCTCCISGG